MGGLASQMLSQLNVGPLPSNRKLPSAEMLFELGSTDGTHITFEEFLDLMFSPDDLMEEEKFNYLKALCKLLTGAGDITMDQLTKCFQTRILLFCMKYSRDLIGVAVAL